MHDFRKLDVWREAHRLTLEVYRTTRGFPSEERYGLAQELRRACVSIEANISEGTGRRTSADFARFLDIASGSSSETESMLQIGVDCGFVTRADGQALLTLVSRIRRMLWSLTQTVRSSPPS